MHAFYILRDIYVNIIIYNTMTIVKKSNIRGTKLSYNFVFVLVIFTYTIAQAIITTHND